MTDALTVAMVLFNADALALQSLTHLLAYTPGNLRFVLVNNGAPSARHLLRWLPEEQCTFVQNPTNLGYYAAMNRALHAAETETVIIAAPDHLVLPGWWQGPMVAVRDMDVAWASPEWRTGRYDPACAWEALTAEARGIMLGQCSTSCAVINWALLKSAVGYFDERFFLTYGDTDYLERMRDAGLRYGIVSGTRTHHDEHGCRRTTSPEADTEAELRDEAVFRDKYAARPDVLARHPPLAAHAAALIAGKRREWA